MWSVGVVGPVTEGGLAADLQCQAASVAGSTLRLPPVSGPEITNFLCVS